MFSASRLGLDQLHSQGEHFAMPATIAQVTHEALAFSDTERAHLAETLLRSLEPEEDEGVEAACEAEIARRVEEIRSGTAQGRPAEDVFRDVRARYGW